MVTKQLDVNNFYGKLSHRDRGLLPANKKPLKPRGSLLTGSSTTVDNSTNFKSLHYQLSKSRLEGGVMAGGNGPEDANLGTKRS